MVTAERTGVDTANPIINHRSSSTSRLWTICIDGYIYPKRFLTVLPLKKIPVL